MSDAPISAPPRSDGLARRQALHDAANWLTVVLGHLEMLRDASPAEAGTHLDLARRAARAAHRLCLSDSAVPVAARHEFDAARCCQRLLEHASRLAESRGVTLSVDLQCAEPVLADETGFEDAVLNLLRNAVQAVGAGGCIVLRLTRSKTGVARLEVVDNGPGIPPEVLERLGEPGVTTRSAGDHGLGLSRVRVWVEAAGGVLDVQTTPGEGTKIGFELPLAAVSPASGGAAPGRLRIHLVEDDPAVAEVLAALLRVDGHEVVVSADIASARRDFEPTMFDLVICDQGLPDGTGEELLRAFRKQDRTAALVLLTGDPSSLALGPGDALDRVVAKPAGRADLQAVTSAARELCARRRARDRARSHHAGA